MLEEVPTLLDRVNELGERFAAAGWRGVGLMRARAGDAVEFERRGVLVVPAGESGDLVQATPAYVLGDDELAAAI